MRFLADENFDNKILNGLHKAMADLDIRRAQDTGIYQASDPKLLAWAAKEQLILLTHDRQTLIKFAYARVEAGLPMPGVIEIARNVPVGQLIEELSILIGAG